MAMKVGRIYWHFDGSFHFEELKSSFESRGYHLRDSTDEMKGSPTDQESESSFDESINADNKGQILYSPTEAEIVDCWQQDYNLGYYWWIQESGLAMPSKLYSGVWRIEPDVVAELYILDAFKYPYMQNAVQAIEDRFMFLADRGIAELLIVDLGGGTEEYDWTSLFLKSKVKYEDVIRYGLSYPNIIGIRKVKAASLMGHFSGVPGWSWDTRGDYVIFKGADVNQHPDPIDTRDYLEQRRRRFWD